MDPPLHKRTDRGLATLSAPVGWVSAVFDIIVGARPEPRSRHLRRLWQRQLQMRLLAGFRRLRQDNPLWSKRKLGPILRVAGWTVSDSTVGRMPAHLRARSSRVTDLLDDDADRDKTFRPHDAPGQVTPFECLCRRDSEHPVKTACAPHMA